MDYKPQVVKGLAGNVIGCEYKAITPKGIKTIFQECYKCHSPDDVPEGCLKFTPFLYWGA